MQLHKLHKVHHSTIVGLSILWIVFFRSAIGFSQPSYNSFLEEKDLNRKANKAYELFHYYIRHDLDSAKITGVELILSDKVDKNEAARSMGARILGAYLIRSGELRIGLKMLKMSADHYIKCGNYTLASETYNDIGHGYFLWGEFDEAMRAYSISLDLGKDATDRTASFNGKLGMAKTCLQLGDTIAAEHLLKSYRERSIQLSKYEAAADATTLLADIKLFRGDSEEGIRMMWEGIDLSRNSGSQVHESHALTNLGILYFELGRRDSSLICFEEALSIRKKLNNSKTVCEAYFNLGDYYRMSGMPNMALDYYLLADSLAEMKGLLQDQIDALEGLFSIDGIEHRFKSDFSEYREKLDSLGKLLESKSGLNKEVFSIALEALHDREEIASPIHERSFLWTLFVLVIFTLGIVLLLRAKY